MTKFYILVTHSIFWKSEKFHYIIYRIYKIMLLLVMAIGNIAVATLKKTLS